MRTIDHRLERRRVLTRLGNGELTRQDVCDADRTLLSSAEVLGVVTDRLCPVCRSSELRDTFWIHGSGLGEKSGTARSVVEIQNAVAALGSPVEQGSLPVRGPRGEARGEPDDELAVHAVEVCLRCGWNHLVREDLYP